MYLETADSVVFTDLHAQVDALERLYSFYGDNVRYLSGGDEIDGPDTLATLDMMRDMGVRRVDGNHTLVTKAVVYERDPDARAGWCDAWRPTDPAYRPIEYKTLASYGIDPALPNDEAAAALRQRWEETGHGDFLRGNALYIETEEFIVVHAGLLNYAWSDQRRHLDHIRRQHMRGDYSSTPEPEQVFDVFDRTAKKYRLATQTEAFAAATGKIVITGHVHTHEGADSRTTADGKRVRLASRLALGEPLFVWQSWDHQVIAI